MSVYLPLRADGTPFYSFEVPLDGVRFGLVFRWNARFEYWTFDIKDASGNVLLAGRKVVVDVPLLGRFKNEGLPAGDLLAVDTTGERQDPGLADFGTRVRMIYLTAEDVAALVAEG